MKQNVLITGASGLIGSQCVEFFSDLGFNVIGVDNNMRAYFFGRDASTQSIKERLESKYPLYQCLPLDVREMGAIEFVFKKTNIDLIIHTAAQPSHDWAVREPLTDFSVNAQGTLNLLELCRLYCPEATFIFTSTNKVYGDTPNKLKLTELETRYECFDPQGLPYSIDEGMSIDQCTHSIFGASKVAADIMVQEYGRCFNIKTGVFRGGCLTGPNHKGAELHGFLSYLVKCITHGEDYTIFGYKGKQVRDNIHSADLVNMFWEFHQKPRRGEVYNVGGGRGNSVSVLEAIDKIKKISNKKWDSYSLSPQARAGDHMWYITDFSKFQNHFPSWQLTHSIDQIIEEIVKYEHDSAT